MATCPNCGTTGRFQTNGHKPSSVNFALLCIARVAPRESALNHEVPTPDQIDQDGKVACAMQWSPNDA